MQELEPRIFLPENPILEVGPGKHPHPRANVRIDIVANPLANYIMDVHRMNFLDQSFEQVLMFECLEHTAMPLVALREIHRILKPGGKLSLSVPNVYFYPQLLRWIFKGKINANPEHIFAWTIWEIRQLLARADFEIISVSPHNEDWFYKRPFWYRLAPRIAAHSIAIEAVKH